MSKHLPHNLAPRGLSLKQASAYWGVSTGTFKKLERAGVVPSPIRLGDRGKQIYDRNALDGAMDAASAPRSETVDLADEL